MGLQVISIISDQGSNFLSFTQDQGVAVQRPFLEMRGKRYYIIFDPPHLLKSLRNNLLKYNFLFENKIASWDHIKTFYNKEREKPIRTAPKLTSKHIDPNGFMKMKVKFASQVFSHSVSAGMLLYVRFGGLPSRQQVQLNFWK